MFCGGEYVRHGGCGGAWCVEGVVFANVRGLYQKIAQRQCL